MKATLNWEASDTLSAVARITHANLRWLGGLMLLTLAVALWIAVTAVEFFQQSSDALHAYMAAGGLLLLALGALGACVACLLLLYELRPLDD